MQSHTFRQYDPDRCAGCGYLNVLSRSVSYDPAIVAFVVPLGAVLGIEWAMVPGLRRRSLAASEWSGEWSYTGHSYSTVDCRLFSLYIQPQMIRPRLLRRFQ